MYGVAVAVVAAALLGDVGTSGLHGRVCRGARPAPAAASQCTRTQPTVFRLSGGGRTFTVRTRADGTYRVLAPAGVYRVTLAFRTALPVSLRPALVRIRAGHDDRLDLWYATRTL